MRHRCKDHKLGRSGSHRKALVASLVCSLIEHKRITTTLAKAKSARSLAEQMVTMGKKGSLAARRRAISELRRDDCVRVLFEEIVPRCQDRQGGYTRTVKLGRRYADGSEMAVLEWVSIPAVAATKKKPKKQAEAAAKTTDQ